MFDLKAKINLKFKQLNKVFVVVQCFYLVDYFLIIIIVDNYFIAAINCSIFNIGFIFIDSQFPMLNFIITNYISNIKINLLIEIIKFYFTPELDCFVNFINFTIERN